MQEKALSHTARWARTQGVTALPDATLLERFVFARDEIAFQTLVRRHGPLVLGVCRRVLRHEQDAEDAFQATFIVLARKAGSVADAAGLPGWLYRVAYRVALKAKTADRRLPRREPLPDGDGPESCARGPAAAAAWRDARPVLDQEISWLPENCRAPVILCYLQSKTTDEAAAQLGWPRGTVATRLSQARDLLRKRLARRGLAVATLRAILPETSAFGAVSPALASSATRAGGCAVRGELTEAVSASVSALADAGMNSMAEAQWKARRAVLLAVALGGVLLLLLQAFAPPVSRSWQVRATLRGHKSVVLAVALTSNGQTLVSAGEDGTVVVWDVRNGAARTTLCGHAGPVHGVALSADGRRVISGGQDGTARLWDAATGQELFCLRGHNGPVTSVAFSPTEPTVAAAGRDGNVSLWHPATGARQATLAHGDRAVLALAYAPDGRSLAAGLRTGAIVVWDVAERRKRTTLQAHAGPAGVAYSPDGRTLASLALNEPVKLWDAATGTQRSALGIGHPMPGQNIRGAAFTADSRTIALAIGHVRGDGQDGLVRFWDASTAVEKTALSQPSPVWAVAFSSDGVTMVTAHQDGAVRLWASGREP